MHDWTITMQAIKNLNVAISANMLTLLPRAVLSMFLNDIRFASGGIIMLSHLLTRLNLSLCENLLLAISDHT